jgi:hypothetical protein
MLHRAHTRRKVALRNIIRFGGGLLRVGCALAFMVWFMNLFLGDKLVEVNADLPLSGVVTGCDVNRQHYYWYLNDEPVRYDLWSFVPGDSATLQLQQQEEARSDPDYYYNTLAYYLKTGDRLQKAAHSPLVTVYQDGRTTVWKYAP